MRVVHLSNTPVAGSPGNIVSALNRHTDIEARHVVFNASAYGARTFAVDIDWQTRRDEALAAIDAADVIHIHQYFEFYQTFGDDLPKRFGGRKLIRQYHSAPALWAKQDSALLTRIVTDPVPQLVIAQGPERYYPFARVVPNLVPLYDGRYLPGPEADGPPVVVYSPSGRASAWKTRWETKGAPQTLALLRKLERKGLCRVQVIVDTPHDACLRIKQAAALAVDECVTGNYHLSGLEALSQGKPTIGHLDARVQSQLRHLTGAVELPWVDVRLEEAEPVLRALLADRRLREEVGAASRRWMETYYDEATLVGHYRRAYLDLFEAPERFGMQRFTTHAQQWSAVALPDHSWAQRRRAGLPLWRHAVEALKQFARPASGAGRD
ncbi:glycosyltransferase family protein [Paraburkholderia ferrariae]|uniref:glycosyltransferase family 1 protein n=1 Tax=Paraburkholderia ferrariae TaxID=386056 RepID=UPI00048893A3|nr:glycosyltransferase family 1 protein [Paraburkholderia ferrariae]